MATNVLLCGLGLVLYCQCGRLLQDVITVAYL